MKTLETKFQGACILFHSIEAMLVTCIVIIASMPSIPDMWINENCVLQTQIGGYNGFFMSDHTCLQQVTFALIKITEQRMVPTLRSLDGVYIPGYSKLLGQNPET